jgi:hypothetical protein
VVITDLSFLGLLKEEKPLTKLTEKGITMVWTQECQEAFVNLKERLCKAPVSAMPYFYLEFILDTDASNISNGAVLSQKINGEEKPTAYASDASCRKLSASIA